MKINCAILSKPNNILTYLRKCLKNYHKLNFTFENVNRTAKLQTYSTIGQIIIQHKDKS